MRKPVFLELIKLEIALHRVKLYHTVADRRAGREYYPSPAGYLVYIAALEI